MAPRAKLLFICAVLVSSLHGSNALLPVIAKVGTCYKVALRTRPFATYSAQGAAIAGTGDAISQALTWTKDSKNMDAGRVSRAAASGVLYNGILLPWYYKKIQDWIPSRAPVAVGLKVAFDQVLWGFGGNFQLITLRRCLEGASLKGAFRHAQETIWPVFRSDMVVWTTYNALCYGVIPQRFQPISTAVMSAAWGAYISTVSTKGL
mmetsp:Transcript_67358/g.140344  ORF Transcript_67358/g.140344 Transcript_67358/m.140344 type:complete len:206 (-) Transcript_67358:182-799(-)|eukprot:CAMPEP_0181316672 /NCGR_PEP_ID=MMETSP1101-20121128/16023_1 /TAXON_ID=46948 /ORGANISM="Rhodomonas abbreviata, Strain Caron Lab Isolate" /LENGTH=205 /DNA_ID=CAMNT_0023423941 /DNA_START=86 /DNA_END=703 /DNA_ORIENTATION=+